MSLAYTGKKQVRLLFESVEEDYRDLWAVLEQLKIRKPGKELLEFQGKLARILQRLSRAYHEIAERERKLLSKKKGVSRGWFVANMRACGACKDAIKEAIWLGRGLGDAFSWILLQYDREYIENQMAAPLQEIMPRGTGGEGEISIIDNPKLLDGYFMLFHGNTSFLRVGDVTIVDLNTMKVSATAEIKTIGKKDKWLHGQLHFVGRKKDKKLYQAIRNLPRDMERWGDGTQRQLPQALQATLDRQLKRMSGTFDSSQERLGNIEFHDSYNFEALERLGLKLGTRRSAWIQADDGLLLWGIRTKRQSLATRLLPYSGIGKSYMRGMPDATKEIFLTEGEDNTLMIHQLYPGKLALGGTPIFWWPIRVDFLRELFFQKVVVVTLFNPAHIIHKLRDQGYAVELEPGGRLKISKSVDEELSLNFSDATVFLSWVSKHLMKESAIVEVISSAEQASASKSQPERGIVLAVQHHGFGISEYDKESAVQ